MDTEPPNASAFHDGERRAQSRWGDPGLWDAAMRERLLWPSIPSEHHARIEAVPFFFLATSGADGSCDCSFKGGGPGLIKMLADDRLAFPDFDGNNAFMSLGNLLENPRVGMLLIDFSDATRLRINGRAKIVDGAQAAAIFPGAARAVVVDIELAVPNCKQYVPRLIASEGASGGTPR